MIIGRTFVHVASLFMVLVGKGLPVKMHGQTDTAKMIKSLLDELLVSLRCVANVSSHVDPPCASTYVLTVQDAPQVLSELITYASTNCPSTNLIEFDLHVGLMQIIKLFASSEPCPDLTMPAAACSLADFIYAFFEPNEKKIGVIQLGTIHWAKGLEADDVRRRLQPTHAQQACNPN